MLKKLARALKLISKDSVYQLPSPNNAYILINAPCDLDRIPEDYLARGKSIYVAHNCPEHLWHHKNYFGFNRESRIKKLSLIKTIACLSASYIETYSKMFGFPENQIIPFAHTVEIPEVKISKHASKTIITICRLENKAKRLDRLFEIAQLLPSYQFKIYGSGPDELLLRKQAKNITNISFQGPTNDITTAHREAGVFLMTSDIEGFGITIIESLSQATPVIIARNSFARARDLIKDNYNGYVVEEYSAIHTVQRIEKIIENYEDFSQNALTSFSRFSRTNFKNAWDNIFRQTETF